MRSEDPAGTGPLADSARKRVGLGVLTPLDEAIPELRSKAAEAQ
jgi:hypothetical protein